MFLVLYTFSKLYNLEPAINIMEYNKDLIDGRANEVKLLNEYFHRNMRDLKFYTFLTYLF